MFENCFFICVRLAYILKDMKYQFETVNFKVFVMSVNIRVV